MVKGAEYTIFKRGADGKRGIIIDKYTDLQIEFRWTEPSKFAISSLGSSRIPLTIGNGIDVYRNGELFLTGVVETAEESCDEMQNGVITWRVEGRDISSLLDRRLVLPDPVGLNFSESVQDVIVDSVAGAIKRYVERNGGVSAASGRRLGNLTVPAQSPDPNGNTYAYRLQPLSKVCAEIGAGEAMPVIECDPETGLMELKVATRRERADSVIFSPENGTITRWSKTRKLPKVNSLWAMSGGEEQIVTHSKNEDSIAAFGAFEGFIKDSAQVQEATEDKPAVTSVDVVGILEKKSADKLNKEAATESYSVDVCESPVLRFVDDWLCGDRVTCVIDGEEIISTIESVSVSVNSTAEKVTAKIGDVERGLFAEIFSQVSELQEKIEIERVTTSVVSGGGSSEPIIEFETSAANIKPVGTASVGSLSTVPRADHVHPIEDTGWINFTLLNGWYDWTGWVVPGYRKVNGRVQFRGLIRKPDTNYLQTIAVLPDGFRPADHSMFCVNHGAAIAAIQVLYDGRVAIEFTAQPNAGTWLGLSGITFFAA